MTHTYTHTYTSSGEQQHQAAGQHRTHAHTLHLHINTHRTFKVANTLPYSRHPMLNTRKHIPTCLHAFPTHSNHSTRTLSPTHTHTPTPTLSIHTHSPPAFPFLPCSRLWRLSCACWCSSSTHSGLLHEPNTFTLCCHGDLKWAAPLLLPPLLLLPPPPLTLLWPPSPWLLLLPPRLPPSASRPPVAGRGREGEKEREKGGSDGWRERGTTREGKK